MATIITEPHRTKAGGISPNRLRTFSERSYISLHTFFCFISISFMFYPIIMGCYFMLHLSVSELKLILDQSVVCSLFFN